MKFICILLFPLSILLAQKDLNIFIVAGQSNALNIHADANLLPSYELDTTIKFYYHCGVPPSKSSTPFFSTSNNEWTFLKTQHQNPFIGSYIDFFGPEISFAKEVKQSYPRVAIMKFAYGGSSLANDWYPNATSGNMLYKTMLNQIDTACRLLREQGFTYKFSGFLWVQGEADAANALMASAYYNNLSLFIESLRRDLNNHELPFALNILPSSQPYPYLSTVREAQIKIGSVLNVSSVFVDDLELENDKVHFVAPSVIELGKRTGYQFLIITQVDEEKTNPDDFYISNAFPNPFNPTTRINYSLGSSEYVKIYLINVLGEEVEILHDGLKNKGTHYIDINGSQFNSGIYFVRFVTENKSYSTKIILTK